MRLWMMQTIIFVLAVLLILGAALTAAHAHSDGDMVYDLECCYDKDCGPVLKMEKNELGDLMTTKHGTVLVNSNLLESHRRRVSKDGRWHVCMRPRAEYEEQSYPGVNYVPICVYFPQLY